MKRIVSGKPLSLDVTLEDAREMAYHYIRTHFGEDVRPVKLEISDGNSYGEPVWRIELGEKENGRKRGDLEIGVKTGAVHGFEPATLGATTSA